jgi:hypothetical protein
MVKKLESVIFSTFNEEANVVASGEGARGAPATPEQACGRAEVANHRFIRTKVC